MTDLLTAVAELMRSDARFDTPEVVDDELLVGFAGESHALKAELV